MFLNGMGFRRLFYETIGICFAKNYWNTYIGSLKKVEDDMEKQMDMVTLMRRLRAHGFALSMLFDKKTLKMISDKSVGKPCEPDPEVCTNLWGTYDMFTGAEKGVIAEAEMEHTEGNSVLLGKSSFGPHNARAQKALMLAASLSGRNMVEHQGG